MNFSEAMLLLKEGKKVRRKEWNNSNYIECKDDTLWVANGDKYSSWKFVKIEHIMADDWEEYKKPSLTDEEKEYLKMIIKFGGYHIKTIEKNKLCPSMHNRSFLIFNKCWGEADEPYDDSPLFDANKYFTGIEFGKEYTLRELGLID